MVESAINWAVEILTQDPPPSSTKCWRITTHAGPNRDIEAGSANKLLPALVGKDPIEGPINTGVELLHRF